MQADDTTRVWFDITLAPRAPVPELPIKRTNKTLLSAATEGLCQCVLGAQTVERANPQAR